MIVKFLANKTGGGLGSVNYLLDAKRVQNGTARVLKGDEQNTRDLIMTITKKQKTTFGVLSFEESNIPEAQKYELMAEFEKTFFAGLRKDQYNILWVEHTDKGRLELNCIIPKIELSTGKAFNPYFHGSDLHIKDLFTKSMNLKYGYSDPQDPAKSASVQGSKKQIGLFKDYEELDQKLKQLVADGTIQDRSELIDLLKENGIEVTRQGANYISIKLPESKKARKFNGGIYDKKFTSVDELRDISEDSSQRERAFTSRDREIEHREVDQRLNFAVSKRAQYNEKLYSEPGKRERTVAERAKKRATELKIVQTEHSRSSQERPIEDKEVGKKIDLELVKGEIENDGIRSAVNEYARAREKRNRARARRSSERAQRIKYYITANSATAKTDYRAIAEAQRGRRFRDNIEKNIKQFSGILDRIASRIAEMIAKKFDKELVKIREIFAKDETGASAEFKFRV